MRMSDDVGRGRECEAAGQADVVGSDWSGGWRECEARPQLGLGLHSIVFNNLNI